MNSIFRAVFLVASTWAIGADAFRPRLKSQRSPASRTML